MLKDRPTDKLAVILHADVAGSTRLVQLNEHLAHERIQDSFNRFAGVIKSYGGTVLEIRGDALLAVFESVSVAVTATLVFQSDQDRYLSQLDDEVKPAIRSGIAMGEVVIGDNTVTGGGVVLSQRVEQLARPGGICITAAVEEALPARMPFEIESIGGQALKGFEAPVHVYRVRLKTGAEIPPPRRQQRAKLPLSSAKAKVASILVLAALVFSFTIFLLQPGFVPDIPLPDKPSIAVLPFTNMSADREQEYFVDGMTNDLITDFSKIPDLFVIAHNTMRLYKGQTVDAHEVAQELGVHYVVEGSVQRAGRQVRVNAMLIDAASGEQVWAERYDGTLDDVFAMRDEITQNIVTSLSLRLVGRDASQTDSPEAYDAYLRGMAHYRLNTPEDFARAIPYLENALTLDPDFGSAHATLAAIYSGIYRSGWAPGTGVAYDDAYNRLNYHLGEARKKPTTLAYSTAARQLEFFGRYDEAMAEALKAIELDANDPNGYDAVSTLLVHLGNPDEGLSYIQKAMRLDPQSDYLYQLGTIQFHLERYDEAAETFLRASKRNPRYEWNYLMLAATYGQLGLESEAEAPLAVFNDLVHDPRDKQLPFTLADLVDITRNETGLERLRTGLRRVGVPEGPTGTPANLKFVELVKVSNGNFDVTGAIRIDAVEAKTLQESGALFFDSRGRDAYAAGHIPGAKHLFFHQVWDELEELAARDTEIVFYCEDPGCHLAAHSSAQALTLGFGRVYYFAGGFEEWKQSGFPVESS